MSQKDFMEKASKMATLLGSCMKQIFKNYSINIFCVMYFYKFYIPPHPRDLWARVRIISRIAVCKHLPEVEFPELIQVKTDNRCISLEEENDGTCPQLTTAFPQFWIDPQIFRECLLCSRTTHDSGPGNTIVNKTSESFCPHTAYVPTVGEDVWRKMKICKVAYGNKGYGAK